MKHECPSQEELRSFLDRGKILPESSGLQSHVDSCWKCQGVLEELTSADWIPAFETHRRVDAGPVLQRLGEDLQQLFSATTVESGTEPSTEQAVNADWHTPLDRLREFRIIQRLASGTQGTMYLAYDEKLHRKVAIKVLNQGLLAEEDSQKRFEREARLAASLNDERIVRVYQVHQERELPPFIVMEFVAGCSLKQRLEISRPTIPETVKWVRDAALGLSVAHRAGLIHRDIKPSNLMLDEKTGLTRLTDFGLALERADANRLTQEGILTGTPAYMSPEQLSRPASVDCRTDIYSLGVVLYELLAGEVPFRGNLRMTLLQVAHDEPRSPRQFNDQIPIDLETITLKAMARDPDRRFESATAFAEELERWQLGIPILSRPAGLIEMGWRWCRRRPQVAALSASTLGLFLTLAVVMLFSYLRLEQSARQKQRDAETAAQQRDAALEVLSQLVFQLQTQFEQDIVNVDDLQKNSLQIAIDGLSRLKQLTDQEQFPEALTAEAFRKMGEIQMRLGLPDEARDSFVRSERGYRELQLRPDSRQSALLGIVETLWSRHDLEVEADNTESLTNWLLPATTAARELFELAPSDKTKLTLAQALFHEAQFEFDDSDLEQAVPGLDAKLIEIYELVKLEDDADLSSAQHSESVRLWLETTELESRYRMGLAEDERARTLLTSALKRMSEYRGEFNALSPLASLEITLEYLLYSLLLDSDFKNQASAHLTNVEQKLVRLKELVSVHSIQLKNGLEFFQELGDRFEEENDEQGRLFFLLHTLDLLEMRLIQVPGDEFACLERAYCKFEIAEAKSMLEVPEKDVRQAYREAVKEYRELSTRASFEEQHWFDYCSVLLSAAEFEKLIQGSDLTALRSEAHRVRNTISKDFPQFSAAFLRQVDQRLDELLAEE